VVAGTIFGCDDCSVAFDWMFSGFSLMGFTMQNNGRTYQQNLVWSRLSDGLKDVQLANENLENKATKIVAGSTGAIAAIAGVNMLPQALNEVGHLEGIILAMLCASVLVMFWYAAKLWGPQPTSVTTTSDVNRLFDEYIAKPEDVAFNNALIDTAKAFEHAVWVNKIKGSELRHMFIVLQSQVAVLGFGVLLKAFF